MTTILTVLGTRPEIIKLSPLLPLLDTRYHHVLVHTGQHYDHILDGVFFQELSLRSPEFRLGVGSGSQGIQLARMLTALEPIVLDVQPTAVLVQGDTNSTLAGALIAAKLGLPVIHVEAGCRSFNRSMPEETNRVVVDHCAELLLSADERGQAHLIAEGIARQKIRVVGSTAIDACLRSVRFANRSTILQDLALSSRGYALCTIHRAENTQSTVLPALVSCLNTVARYQRLVVPLHPRTAAAMRAQGLSWVPEVCVINPLGYTDLLQLLRHAKAVMTDSGGLQEEAAALNVPLLILRRETEWEYLVTGNKAALVGNQTATLITGLTRGLEEEALAAMRAAPNLARPGATQRIIDCLTTWLTTQEDADARTFAQPLMALGA